MAFHVSTARWMVVYISVHMYLFGSQFLSDQDEDEHCFSVLLIMFLIVWLLIYCVFYCRFYSSGFVQVLCGRSESKV